MNRAIEIAKQHIPIQQYCTKEEFWCGFTIVLHNDRYSVYDADAWEKPSEVPLLPWSPPKGVKVAHVAIDGAVTLV